ncbi:L-2-hydroxyglutarate oxidase [Marinitenerispora sediminis]|uniref:L-2-hydroxyglutarate oxidase n=1 Tax=Marinitenerispora sediminis TaxID=1931232 RepID=UPI001F1CF5C2|nr:L-2-hydroxyglutarate oxidase [Marinitenerispora sediminis]
MAVYDFCVVGGGIVGLATAMRLLELRPGASLLLLEKEDRLGAHQTGHNSGVIHSGIYYPPGSLKAEYCRRGARMTKEFCAERSIAFDECGKLLVATSPRELERLEALHERAGRNGLEVRRLGAGELREREPMVRGLGALLVPSAGIVDYRRVARAMGEVVRARGGRVELGAEVTAIAESASRVAVTAGGRSWSCGRLVVCGGLQADRLARLAGLRSGLRIVPFRGEYYRLPARRRGIVRHLVYPVPDPRLPFLGVHLSPTVDGGVTVGPNAVLALAREGYPKFSVRARDVLDYAAFPGLWRLASAHPGTAVREVRDSLWKRGYLRECRRYCPDLTLADLLPAEAGIRAQAVLRDGTLVHDFLLERTDRMVHVLNAPSPAATSALPIGAAIAEDCVRPVR